jgi:hypothetical protein
MSIVQAGTSKAWIPSRDVWLLLLRRRGAVLGIALRNDQHRRRTHGASTDSRISATMTEEYFCAMFPRAFFDHHRLKFFFMMMSLCCIFQKKYLGARARHFGFEKKKE